MSTSKAKGKFDKNLDRNISDCRASKIISIDTKAKAILRQSFHMEHLIRKKSISFDAFILAACRGKSSLSKTDRKFDFTGV